MDFDTGQIQLFKSMLMADLIVMPRKYKASNIHSENQLRSL